jgi:DNA-binding FadR family transcriptional regulator
MPADFETLLSPAVRVRSLDDVVSKLREILLSGSVAVGERLPSERELSRILTVGRTTVREALRNLEAHGLVDIRLGGTGGAFFTGPDAALVGAALSTLLLFEAATEHDLNEFRFDFEQVNAELAAIRATPQQRRHLEGLLAQVRDAPAAMDWETIEAIDLEVHELLPVLSQNSVRVAVSRGIHDALQRSFERIEPQSDSPATLRQEVIVLLELLIAGDGAGARSAMADHLLRWRP